MAAGATTGPGALQRTFQDEQRQQADEFDGFVTAPMLDSDQVRALRADLDQLLGDSETPFVGAMDGDTLSFRQASGDVIRGHVEFIAAEQLPGQDFFMTAYFSKAPLFAKEQ